MEIIRLFVLIFLLFIIIIVSILYGYCVRIEEENSSLNKFKSRAKKAFKDYEEIIESQEVQIEYLRRQIKKGGMKK